MFCIDCMEAVISCLNIGIQPVVTNLEGQDLSWFDKPPYKGAFANTLLHPSLAPCSSVFLFFH